MKYISAEENKKVLNEIESIGWENYTHNILTEGTNNEPVVIRIKGTIEEYAKRNGYINAVEAMKIIEQTRTK